ncbi:hypothetical protein ACXR2W_06475 [Leucobacter sp. HY1908]
MAETTGPATGGKSSDAKSSGATPATVPEEAAAAEAATTDHVVRVEPIGDGPIGLRLVDPSSIEANEQFSGKVITGPGGCLSLTASERPYTLVFDAPTNFGLANQRPQVSDGTLGSVHVGNWIDFTGTRVAIADTTGVPDRCAKGSDFVVAIGSDSTR